MFYERKIAEAKTKFEQEKVRGFIRCTLNGILLKYFGLRAERTYFSKIRFSKRLEKLVEQAYTLSGNRYEHPGYDYGYLPFNAKEVVSNG